MSATINYSNKETARALLYLLPLLHSANSLFPLKLHWLQWRAEQEKACHIILYLAGSSMALIILGLTLLLDGILIDVNKTSQVFLDVGVFFVVFFFSRKWGALW